MDASISTNINIGPSYTNIFRQMGFYTIGQLKVFSGDEKSIMSLLEKSVIDKMNPRPYYWNRVCKRCFTIINRLRNANALPFHPYYTICPISQELMEDPVISPSGISYDRVNIEEYLQLNGTELNGVSLNVEQLYPNCNLREVIKHYHNNYQMYNI